MAAARSPFFNGIKQRELAIRQYRGKSPMFFWGARMLGAMFFVDLGAARALLPDPRLQPIAAAPGRGVMGVFALDYGGTDLGPYREVFIAIGVHAGKSTLPQPLRTARALFSRSLDAHVVQLPVDSESALFGGVDHYNVPKFMARIDVADLDGARAVTVRDPDNGALVFSLRSPKPAERRPRRNVLIERQTLRNFSLIDGRLAEARYELYTPGAQVALHGLNGPMLIFGDHPRAACLADLKPSKAVASFFADGGEAILYEPTFW